MKKLFTNDKFFLAVTVIAVLSQLIMFVYAAFLSFYTFIPLAQIACEIVLYVSFKRHSKNVMKGMMGALLMLIMVNASQFLQGKELMIDKVGGIVFFVLTVFLFINHFVINSTHLSSKTNILANQITVVLIPVTIIVWDIALFLSHSMIFDYFTGILDMICFTFSAPVIVCVESRLDAYRLDREAAGWTEEAGYPEGYVHEYEKNK